MLVMPVGNMSSCVWTVNTALGLCALNGVGGPSEPRLFQVGSWQMPNL